MRRGRGARPRRRACLRRAERLPRAGAARHDDAPAVPQPPDGEGRHRGGRDPAHRGRPHPRRRSIGRLRPSPGQRRPPRRLPGVRVARHRSRRPPPADTVARPAVRRRRQPRPARQVCCGSSASTCASTATSTTPTSPRSPRRSGASSLTRDRGLLKRRQVSRGLFVRADRPLDQIVEVLRRLDLAGRLAPFTRCLRCGGRLTAVSKADVLDRLEPLTRRHVDDFARCERLRPGVLEGIPPRAPRGARRRDRGRASRGTGHGGHEGRRRRRMTRPERPLVAPPPPHAVEQS